MPWPQNAANATRRPARGRQQSPSARLSPRLQPLGRPADQEVADLALGGAAEQHPEHAARVDLQAVRRAGPLAAQVLEVPPAVQGLDVAALLLPRDRAELLVGEAKPRADGADLGVALGLDRQGAPLRVALVDLDVLQRRLPLGRVLDVGRDRVDEVRRRLDLDRALPADGAHGAADYLRGPSALTTASTSANSRPSTSPRLVSRSAGMTPSDRNETIMNGYSSEQPSSL
jgi:hypothetical protein